MLKTLFEQTRILLCGGQRESSACLLWLVRDEKERSLQMQKANPKAVLSALSEEWSEILPSERTRKRAERLLLIHPLRAADAFQHSSTHMEAEETPQGLEFVLSGSKLSEAASKEGFTILP